MLLFFYGILKNKKMNIYSRKDTESQIWKTITNKWLPSERGRGKGEIKVWD